LTVDPEVLARRKHPDAECENCDLVNTGVFVPSKFPDEGDAQYAVVGEAPGFQEAQYGQPFIGASGQLLNKVLEHHSIARKNLLLTNACLCRPEDNATPSLQAQRSCRKRLITELEKAKPQRVLALGAKAADSLMQNVRPITQRRVGNARTNPEGLTVVPTVHPAYCLRNGDAFPFLVRDVEKLYRDMPEWQPPEYVIADDEETAMFILNEIDGHANGLYVDGKQVLVFDIECGIDKDNDFDHPDRYQMLCIGVAYAKGKVVVFGERVMNNKKVIDAIARLFKKSLLGAHNGKFDCAGVYPLMGEVLLWFDTMLAHYCMDERPGNHKLGQLGPELLGTPDWKHEIDKYLGTDKNYAAIPRPQLYKYNAYDDAVTWDLMEYFLVELERRNLRGLHDFLVDASNQLKFLELNGITVDLARNNELSDEYMQILNGLRVQIDNIVQDPEDDKSKKDYDPKFGGLNPASPKQVSTYLHDHGHRVRSTDKDTLEALAARVNRASNIGEFLALLLENRLKAKRHGTYVKGIRRRVYRRRVYTSYLLHGTTSGRLASRNPNLQNIVRDPAIKSQFTVSKPGNVFVHGDYAQAEGRVICTLAKDEYLAAIFRDPNRDLFDELGAGLYPTSFDHSNKDQRVRIKAYFYGLGYGREAFSIAQEYKLPVREVEVELVRFFNLIPDVAKWQTAVKQQVLQQKDLVTAFGRHRRFWLITNENRKDVLNEALSFLPQSTASDICLRAFIRLRPRLRGKAFFRLTIHDALAAECKEEDREYVAAVMREEMLRSAAEWTDYVPFKVDITYGKHWGEL
jgi:uracil-DNA glycosylase family 4